MIQFMVQHQYFLDIKKGIKIAEGRIAKIKYLSLKKDDEIEFVSNKTNEVIKAKVIKINKYNSFKEMLLKEGLKYMLPDIDNLTLGINEYNSFGDYKKEVNKLGCVAIKFRLS